MARRVKADSIDSPQKIRPALTDAARERQLSALAANLAEKQMLDGTASSQVISHYLKLGSSKELMENEIREYQIELIKAKTEAIKSQQRVEELYEAAIDAFKVYNGAEVRHDSDI